MTTTPDYGRSQTKTWQTPELVDLDCGLDAVNAQTGTGNDGGGFSTTSGAIA